MLSTTPIPLSKKTDQKSLDTKQKDFSKTDNTITKVSYLNFLYHYFTCGNFYDAVKQLNKKHGNTDFEVALPFVTMFYIIQNKDYVKKILTENTKAGYQNHNFDISHGHDLNINATHAFLNEKGAEKNPLWKNIHSGLAQSVGDRELINNLIKKHIHTFFAKPKFSLDIAFEEFMLNFWCEYLFGPKVNASEFRATREKFLSAMRYAFYDNRLKSIPYLGNLTCRFYGYLKGNEFKQIDLELTKYIKQATSGLICRFKEKLKQSNDFPASKIDQAVLDNTFDFILVFDFIHNAMYETLVSVVKQKLDATEDRKRVYTQGMNTAFLFPYRVRIPQQEIKLGEHTISKGMPLYIDLIKSGFPHSYGPRSCIGVGVSNWIKDAIWSQLENAQLRIISTTRPTERVKLSHNHDVPVSPERYEVSWQYPRNYLQKILPDYKFNGVTHFYDVIKAYENPILFGYVISSFIERIEKLALDKTNLCIVAPEVRGIPIAAAVANALHVPFMMIRKAGKIPGAVAQVKYSTAYSKDTIELSAESDLQNKHVILMDDGIASGGTTLACCELIKQQGGDVKAIMAMINHTYQKKPAELKQFDVQTLFDFDANDSKQDSKTEILAKLKSS